MIAATCHCGAVRLEVAAAPVEVTECNCSICRRYGVLWAYYGAGDVAVVVAPEQGLDEYRWDDESIVFCRCAACGCVSHWRPVNRPEDRMGMNARLLPPEILAAARRRRLDGAGTERYID